MRNRRCLTSLCALLAALWIAPSSAMSADLISASQIRSTLSSGKPAQQQQLFQNLQQIPSLDEEQATAVAEAVERSLKGKQEQLSLPELQAVYFLRSGTSAKTEAVLLKTLDHSDLRVVILGLDAIAVHKPEAAQAKVEKLVGHRAFPGCYALQRTVVDTAAAYENGKAVSFLIDLLPQLDGQVEFITVQHLRRLTGQAFANNSPQWKQWWIVGAESYRGPPPVDPNKPADNLKQIAEDWNGPLPRFYDVPLFAKKIVFLIDESRSMLSLKDGETRMTRAQQELSQAVQAMAEDVQFNVIAYNEQLEIWQPQLVPATSAAKADAVRFAYTLYPELKTAAYDALSQGLQFDPNTELIVYLSDGKPTAGSIIEPNAIVEAITFQNLFQRTSIDSLGIDTEGESEKFMQDLSAKNYGQYFKIR